MHGDVGTLECGLRIAAGPLPIALGLSGVVGPWRWIGLLSLTTGIFRSCPAYPRLGIGACQSKP